MEAYNDKNPTQPTNYDLGNTILTPIVLKPQNGVSAATRQKMAAEINEHFDSLRSETFALIENTRKETLKVIMGDLDSYRPIDLQASSSSKSNSDMAGKVSLHSENAREDVDDDGEDSDDSEIDGEEAVIRDNLHRYKDYISHAVNVTDLIFYDDLFTDSQIKVLKSIPGSPDKATLKAFETIRMIKHQPEKYRRLLQALEETNYPKIVKILEGKLKPLGSSHRETVRTSTKYMFQQLNTTELLPHLYSKGVINRDDMQQIQRIERNESTGQAVLELSDLLPNRSRHWFKKFIDSLNESGQDDLAKLILIKLSEVEAQKRKNEGAMKGQFVDSETATADNTVKVGQKASESLPRQPPPRPPPPNLNWKKKSVRFNLSPGQDNRTKKENTRPTSSKTSMREGSRGGDLKSGETKPDQGEVHSPKTDEYYVPVSCISVKD